MNDVSSPCLDDMIVIGCVVGVHGLGGWLKIKSFADPVEQLLKYSPLHIGGIDFEHYKSKIHTKGVMLKLPDLDDRTSVEHLIGEDIFIHSSQLAQTAAGEYYWQQLIGMQVINQHGDYLGLVVKILETGANDVLQVENNNQSGARSQVLIPYVLDMYVMDVNLETQTIQVDWEVE